MSSKTETKEFPVVLIWIEGKPVRPKDKIKKHERSNCVLNPLLDILKPVWSVIYQDYHRIYLKTSQNESYLLTLENTSYFEMHVLFSDHAFDFHFLDLIEPPFILTSVLFWINLFWLERQGSKIFYRVAHDR